MDGIIVILIKKVVFGRQKVFNLKQSLLFVVNLIKLYGPLPMQRINEALKYNTHTHHN